MKRLLLWFVYVLCLAQPGWGDKLHLSDVLRELESFHPKMRAAQLLPRLAAAKVLEKEGAFDPQLFLEQEWLRYQSPTAPGKAKFANDNVLGLEIQDLDGWKLRSGYRLNRGDVKSPDSLTGQGGELFVEFKMPLLRKWQVNEKRTALEQARVATRLAEGAAQLIRLELFMTTSLAYWEWCAACTNMRLTERNWKLASERAEQVEKRSKAGDLAPIDSIEARQEAVRRWEGVLKARRDAQKAALKLSLYRWLKDFRSADPPAFELAITLLPSELGPSLLGSAEGEECVPPSQTPKAEDLARWELESLQNRPELGQIEFEKTIISLDKSLAENDRLPILDLTLSPGLDLGSKSIGVTYKAGLQLTIPLATRGPDGRLQAASLKSDKLELDQALEVRRIVTEVRDAFSLVELGHARAETALQSLRLAQKLEEAERIKFQFGDSTLFLVNQRERATLTEAQKVIETLLDYERGLVMAQAAKGRFDHP